MRTGVLVFEGAEELDIFGPYEVLAAAAKYFNAPFAVSLVSLGAPQAFTCALGARIVSHDSLSELNPELLVVPGGGWISRAPVGAFAEAARGDIPRAIAEVHARGTVLATVCTGAMLAANLLRGRVATTHHGARDDLRAVGATISTDRVVDLGDIVTSGGVTSGIDLALHLVNRFAGESAASQTIAYLEYEQRTSP